jgi:hypothetical protein
MTVKAETRVKAKIKAHFDKRFDWIAAHKGARNAIATYLEEKRQRVR